MNKILFKPTSFQSLWAMSSNRWGKRNPPPKKKPQKCTAAKQFNEVYEKKRTDKLNSYNYDDNTVYIARPVKKDKDDNDAK